MGSFAKASPEPTMTKTKPHKVAKPGKAEESPRRGAPSAERTPDAGQKAQVPGAERQSLATGSHLCGRKSTSSCNTAGLRSSALRRKERADDKRNRAERTATRANQAGIGIR